MHEIVALKVLEDYHIWVKFSDGFCKTVDLKPFLGRGFTKELLEYRNFRRVSIEPGGGLEWFNGYDICPNLIRELPQVEKHVA